MKSISNLALPLLLAAVVPGTAMAGTIAAPTVTRAAAGQLTVSWTDADPVDVLVSSDPAAKPEQMKLVSRADKDGRETVSVASGERLYFLLKDRSGQTVRVGERALPLMQASNFRDVGGYPAAGGATAGPGGRREGLREEERGRAEGGHGFGLWRRRLGERVDRARRPLPHSGRLSAGRAWNRNL